MPSSYQKPSAERVSWAIGQVRPTFEHSHGKLDAFLPFRISLMARGNTPVGWTGKGGEPPEGMRPKDFYLPADDFSQGSSAGGSGSEVVSDSDDGETEYLYRESDRETTPCLSLASCGWENAFATGRNTVSTNLMESSGQPTVIVIPCVPTRAEKQEDNVAAITDNHKGVANNIQDPASLVSLESPVDKALVNDDWSHGIRTHVQSELSTTWSNIQAAGRRQRELLDIARSTCQSPRAAEPLESIHSNQNEHSSYLSSASLSTLLATHDTKSCPRRLPSLPSNFSTSAVDKRVAQLKNTSVPEQQDLAIERLLNRRLPPRENFAPNVPLVRQILLLANSSLRATFQGEIANLSTNESQTDTEIGRHAFEKVIPKFS